MTLPGQPSGISQTSFIFATVFVAYLVFITLNGDLPQWLGVLGFGKAPPAPAQTTAPSTPAGASTMTGTGSGLSLQGSSLTGGSALGSAGAGGAAGVFVG